MQNKIKELTTQRDSINNEHRRSVDKMLELKKEKTIYEELKKEVENFFDFTNKEIKYDFNDFDKDGVHKDTGKNYDPNGSNSYGINVNTNDKYDSKGFDIKGIHKDTKAIYDPNDFDINDNYEKTNDKYDSNGFDKYG